MADEKEDIISTKLAQSNHNVAQFKVKLKGNILVGRIMIMKKFKTLSMQSLNI